MPSEWQARFSACLLACLLLVGCAAPGGRGDGPYAELQAPATRPEPADIDVDLARLSEWFGGEWDNHEQVYEAQEAAAPGQPAAAPERMHLGFRPVEVPAIGGSVFHARQLLDDDPGRIVRVRLYRFSVDREQQAIRLDQYSFIDESTWRDARPSAERFAYLRAEDLRYAPDCAVYFRYDAARAEFRGETRRGACRIASERGGQAVTVEDRIELAEGRLWVHSSARDDSGRLVFGSRDGIPHKYRRVRYFEGFAVLRQGGPEAAGEGRWHRMRRILLHSEGRSVALLWEDGRRSGYSLQLARLPFQQGRLQMMTLKLIDDATQQAVSYALGDADGRHIGLNVQWFQASFSEIDGDSRFDPGS